MGLYLLKRILIFIPTLFLITLLSFIISINSPGDPVERLLSGGDDNAGTADRKVTEAVYLAKRKQLGLDLPVFYFSLCSYAETDTLHRVARPHERAMLSRLTRDYGNWEQIQDYFRCATRLEHEAFRIVPDSAQRMIITEIKVAVSELKRTGVKAEVLSHLHRIDSLCRLRPALLAPVRQLTNECAAAFAHIEATATPWKNYIPSFHIYGTQCQYHRWVSGIIRGDFGISYQLSRPVVTALKEAIPWSLTINIIAVIVSYCISVPLGIYSVRNRNTGRERAVTTLLFVLYSLPGFWVATLLITFLCNPEYLHLFPAAGGMDDAHSDAWSWGMRMADYAKHLFLPTLCYTYTAFAFLSRQMRAGMMEVINMDFIRTARAKGLSERTVIWKHALRNSLIPLITHFAGIFPMMVGGSVIIETIFAIPGMGRLSVEAIFSQDHPMIIAIFTLGATLTMVGVLVSDLLYAIVDPRISYSRK